MLVKITAAMKEKLAAAGVESFHSPQASISDEAILEPPCSIKWMQIESAFSLGAFSYAVSGFYSHVSIGRYTSIGEQVQIGRASHPLNWLSTSPFFYLQQRLFDVGHDFDGSVEYHTFRASFRSNARATEFKGISIGNDVYVGHGAFILPGITIGDGAVVAAMSVVTRDVPPYAVVAGNPALVKKTRYSDNVIESLLDIAWWDLAPWQIDKIDVSSPEMQIDKIKALKDNGLKYQPRKVLIKSL